MLSSPLVACIFVPRPKLLEEYAQISPSVRTTKNCGVYVDNKPFFGVQQITGELGYTPSTEKLQEAPTVDARSRSVSFGCDDDGLKEAASLLQSVSRIARDEVHIDCQALSSDFEKNTSTDKIVPENGSSHESQISGRSGNTACSLSTAEVGACPDRGSKLRRTVSADHDLFTCSSPRTKVIEPSVGLQKQAFLAPSSPSLKPSARVTPASSPTWQRNKALTGANITNNLCLSSIKEVPSVEKSPGLDTTPNDLQRCLQNFVMGKHYPLKDCSSLQLQEKMRDDAIGHAPDQDSTSLFIAQTEFKGNSPNVILHSGSFRGRDLSSKVHSNKKMKYLLDGNIVIRKRFNWRDFPELENFLLENRKIYLLYSSKNYSTEQKKFNNGLTTRLIALATECGYIFDPDHFTFAGVRDRIRCFYKSYVQTTKKRLRGHHGLNSSCIRADLASMCP